MTTASEQCVCGHPKEAHKMVVRTRDGKELYCGHCDKCDYGKPPHGCHRFRPELPWPDSEGWWWCESAAFGLCYAFKVQVENLQREYLVTTTDDDARQSDWLERNGPARFTKLIEQSPWSKTDDNSK